MRCSFTFLILIVLIFQSCSEGTKGKTSKKFNKADLTLIQTCVDSTLRLDSNLNSGRYLIDFSLLERLDRESIDSFLRANPDAIETNLDSIISHDPTWVKYEFFNDPVIRFEKIDRQEGGIIVINTSKTKAIDGKIGTEIVLKRYGDNYKCLKSEITWAN